MDGRQPALRVRHAAAVLPLLGAFLLLPPLIALSTAPLRVFGIPLIVLYLFAVWAALIAAAAWLALHLDGSASAAADDGEATRPPGA